MIPANTTIFGNMRRMGVALFIALPHALFFLDSEIGGQKGLRRESRKSVAVNVGFLLFGWSASIPSEANRTNTR
jgi:hypothetical protein